MGAKRETFSTPHCLSPALPLSSMMGSLSISIAMCPGVKPWPTNWLLQKRFWKRHRRKLLTKRRSRSPSQQKRHLPLLRTTPKDRMMTMKVMMTLACAALHRLQQIRHQQLPHLRLRQKPRVCGNRGGDEMAIQTTILNRTFAYSGLTLPDPGKGLSLEEVRDVYAATYPELISASIEGPEKKGDNLVYTFKKGVGTKG